MRGLWSMKQKAQLIPEIKMRFSWFLILVQDTTFSEIHKKNTCVFSQVFSIKAMNLFVSSEKTQQHQEEVDEIEIQTECAEYRHLFSCFGVGHGIFRILFDALHVIGD